MLLVAHARSLEAADSHANVPLLPERRRGLRIRQNRPVKVYEPNAGRYFPGQTCDISSSGLKLELPLSIPAQPGDVLNIYVGLNAVGECLANRRQMMPARIVWIDRRATHSKSRMVAGVELLASIAAQVDAA
jgi:hypothetical protein